MSQVDECVLYDYTNTSSTWTLLLVARHVCPRIDAAM
jgi:hypothetical protein